MIKSSRVTSSVVRTFITKKKSVVRTNKKKKEKMANVVPKVKLNNGTEIPILGLGTWRSKPNEVKNAVVEAVLHEVTIYIFFLDYWIFFWQEKILCFRDTDIWILLKLIWMKLKLVKDWKRFLNCQMEKSREKISILLQRLEFLLFLFRFTTNLSNQTKNLDLQRI